MSSIEEAMRDSNTKVTDEFVADALGKHLSLWKVFMAYLDENGMALEWRFYKDGGWLGKTTLKKKTICWVTLAEGYFSADFCGSGYSDAYWHGFEPLVPRN